MLTPFASPFRRVDIFYVNRTSRPLRRDPRHGDNQTLPFMSVTK